MNILAPLRPCASPTYSSFPADRHNSGTPLIPCSAVEHHAQRSEHGAESGALSKGGSGALAEGVAPPLAGGSLGIYAKYSAILGIIDSETGECLETPVNAKVQRFALQSVARKFLPTFRVGNCLRLRQGGKPIEVWKSKNFPSASYAGLQTCGSVWVCPVCAAKIAERRRFEIIDAMSTHKDNGGNMTMMTLTAPHTRTDKLADILAKQGKALEFLNSDRSVRAIFKEMGIIGQIRALEVTHGRLSPSNNGWHAHYHILQFAGSTPLKIVFSPMQMLEWEDRLYVRWAAGCVRAGLKAPSRLHGIKLDDGSKAAAYVSKWGLEDEMTKGHTKKALHGETPFDFLRSFLADPADKMAAILFKEFAEGFKGKRQLHWSARLKKHFDIAELSDDELGAVMEDDASLLGMISLSQWRDVLRVEGRALLLQIAVSCGWDGVMQYLNSITSKEKNGYSTT